MITMVVAPCSKARRTCALNSYPKSSADTIEFRPVTSLLIPAAPSQCTRGKPKAVGVNAVVMRAEALSRKEGHVGAVAFCRTGDPATGDFSDSKLIKKFGDVPDDLSTL